MSFITEFRMQHFKQLPQLDMDETEDEAPVVRADVDRSRSSRFARYEAMLAEQLDDARTFFNCRIGIQIMVIAMLIGGTMNSGALLNRSQDLPDGVLGDQLITWTESWHGLMERSRMSALFGGIRDAVKAMRMQGWSDIGLRLDHRAASDVPDQKVAANFDAGSG